MSVPASPTSEQVSLGCCAAVQPSEPRATTTGWTPDLPARSCARGHGTASAPDWWDWARIQRKAPGKPLSRGLDHTTLWEEATDSPAMTTSPGPKREYMGSGPPAGVWKTDLAIQAHGRWCSGSPRGPSKPPCACQQSPTADLPSPHPTAILYFHFFILFFFFFF